MFVRRGSGLCVQEQGFVWTELVQDKALRSGDLYWTEVVQDNMPRNGFCARQNRFRISCWGAGICIELNWCRIMCSEREFHGHKLRGTVRKGNFLIFQFVVRSQAHHIGLTVWFLTFVARFHFPEKDRFLFIATVSGPALDTPSSLGTADFVTDYVAATTWT